MVVFGLTISSSWGNGHATLWRGLCNALSRRGWEVVFFERDVPYYAASRDLHAIPGGSLVLYEHWDEARISARQHLREADVAMVTSYCPDGIAATDLVLSCGRARTIFYDLDTPVTLSRLARGEAMTYIGPRALRDFDLVLSFTGGDALGQLRNRLGARRTAPLYGHVDPDVHRPSISSPAFTGDLSYLGTYAPDRQDALEQLFVAAARELPEQRFVIGGAQYPQNFPWTTNIHFVRHLPPADHSAFYASSRLTLNITREAMRTMGWCPSGRLFEAAACGAAILTDSWQGLDDFFQPGNEVLVARTLADTIAVLDRPDAELRRIGEAARARVLQDHTSDRRAEELERLIGDTSSFVDVRAVGA